MLQTKKYCASADVSLNFVLQAHLEMCLHHVCGVHEVVLNKCKHACDTDRAEPQPSEAGPSGTAYEPEEAPLLRYGSPSHDALRAVLLSEKLKRKLPQLARYRSVPRRRTHHRLTILWDNGDTDILLALEIGLGNCCVGIRKIWAALGYQMLLNMMSVK